MKPYDNLYDKEYVGRVLGGAVSVKFSINKRIIDIYFDEDLFLKMDDVRGSLKLLSSAIHSASNIAIDEATKNITEFLQKYYANMQLLMHERSIQNKENREEN